MSIKEYLLLAALVLPASSAVAGDAANRDLVGVWQPVTAKAIYADWTVLVFSGAGRFAALVARRPAAGGLGSNTPVLPVSASDLSRKGATVEFVALDTLDGVGGSWTLGEDGGEVVLAIDNQSRRGIPGTRRYVQMLHLGYELHPYPGMEGRSPLAETSWRKVE